MMCETCDYQDECKNDNCYVLELILGEWIEAILRLED